MILIYKLIWYILSSRSLIVSLFLRQIPSFLCQYISSVLFVFFLIFFSPSCTVFELWEAASVCRPRLARVALLRKGGKYVVVQETKSFVWVYAKLFWHMIYYTNHKPRHNYQYEYMFPRGLCRWSSRIIHECDLTAAISIRLLKSLNGLNFTFV